MNTQSLFAFGLIVLALLFFPAPTSAQSTCWECEFTSCVPADWTGHGYTKCQVVGLDCDFEGGDICWGPDPDRAVQFVRADGTLFLPATGEATLTASMELATAESAGPLAVARSYERNCKGLITRRVYGEVEVAELARRTKHLTI
jgi:hypothetical protein